MPRECHTESSEKRHEENVAGERCSGECHPREGQDSSARGWQLSRGAKGRVRLPEEEHSMYKSAEVGGSM